jgi:hypothetical protein
VLRVPTFQLRRCCCGGGSGKHIEDGGKTLDGKTLGWEPFEATARHRFGRQQRMAPPVPQNTEKAHGSTPVFRVGNTGEAAYVKKRTLWGRHW